MNLPIGHCESGTPYGESPSWCHSHGQEVWVCNQALRAIVTEVGSRQINTQALGSLYKMIASGGKGAVLRVGAEEAEPIGNPITRRENSPIWNIGFHSFQKMGLSLLSQFVSYARPHWGVAISRYETPEGPMCAIVSAEGTLNEPPRPEESPAS